MHQFKEYTAYCLFSSYMQPAKLAWAVATLQFQSLPISGDRKHLVVIGHLVVSLNGVMIWESHLQLDQG